MIIVVGADNSGKTSLVKHLAEKFNLPEVPRYHTLPPVDYVDWYRWVKENLTQEPVDSMSIVDRFFVDEFVYGPVKRGYIGLSGQKMTELRDLISMRRPLIILCHVPLIEIQKTFKDREQYPDLSEIPAIQKEFINVLKEEPFLSCPQVVFNYVKDGDYKSIDKQVSNYLKARGL